MKIKPAAVAGYFYPAQPQQLQQMLQTLLAQANGDYAKPKAIIAPHAGYIYSGKVAASAYAVLANYRDHISRVVLLGPAHRYPVGSLAISSALYFATPLGDLRVDERLRRMVLALQQVQEIDAAFTEEHCLEVQLPFLQMVLKDFTILPLLVGNATPPEVAEVLESVWGDEKTLIVISSDLSHYLDYDTARHKDAQTTQAIVTQSIAGLDYESACGRHAIAGLLDVAQRHHYRIVNRDLNNSGDTAGSKDRVVGYGAYHLYEEGEGQ